MSNRISVLLQFCVNLLHSCVVCHGAAGQGKTTIAWQLFKDEKVIWPARDRAWVKVSKSYTVEKILRDLLQKFGAQPNTAAEPNTDSLKTAVRECLRDKRYVVFFDDVWNRNFWDDFEHVLIDDKKGSRVFITTTDGDVINKCKRSSIIKKHELQPLTENKSRELFYKKAFSHLGGECPPNLEDISSEIVEKCNGLPLAIVAIGGVLATREEDPFVWSDFSKYLSSELEKDPSLTALQKIMGVSYDNLPAYLKPCLLYFGMYPEDYEVQGERLTRQWIAEGFIEKKRGKSMEKVAKEYLTELRRRNVVQVVGDLTWESYQVHDVLRDLILKKSMDLGFGQQFISEVDDDDESTTSSVKSRRLSTTTYSNDFMSSPNDPNIRSLLFFIEGNALAELLSTIPEKFKRLKVLDFEDVRCQYDAPEDLMTLIHLRYLSFKNTGLKNLPESIDNLIFLETLDLRFTKVKVLPKGIGKLTKLLHLLVETGEFAADEDIGGLTSLQTLRGVTLRVDGALEQLKQLEKLVKLRVLRLSKVMNQHKEALYSLLNALKQHLEELHIATIPGHDDALIFDSHFPDIPMLGTLVLGGITFDSLSSGCKNLGQLVMKKGSLAGGAFKSIEDLKNLSTLRLFDTNAGSTLHVHDKGFPNLKHLELSELPQLNIFRIDEGALPSLQTLSLDCIFTEVPSFQHLKKLKRLEVFNSFEFEDVKIIEHVPLVQVYDHESELTHYFEYGKKGIGLQLQ
ncbi:disease resistance protein RPM1-like [Lotus japonicus]|uniref:disease resistance protein RPM1-like n=1 Tax=Lotus japonicus TaxID=34305 RepID=UPI0025838CEE|nr:disease resistance protein RPM1-like [Lotus japonicus]